MVSRATAYNYFPTQESLLVELSVTIDVKELEGIVARPLTANDVEARLLELFATFNRHVLDDEVLYRRALRVYLDMWLATRESDGDGQAPMMRAGRRTKLIADTIAPLRDQLGPDELKRLEAALCLVAGVEPMVVLLDVCRFEPEEALDVTQWVAEIILTAALPQARASHRKRRS